jgi:DNA-directed RNA polymerase specialized sigma54-like protein
MSVKPHLQTTLSQRLVLTPQMRQRIELLAMTKLELTDMVTTELSANPILEEVMPEKAETTSLPRMTSVPSMPRLRIMFRRMAATRRRRLMQLPR